MSEKDLNIEYICEKTLLNKDDELVPIILSLIQESYKAGLCQTEFDNTMNLIEENQELKQKYLNAVADYETTMAEKEQLKKQLENCYCNRTDCAGRIKDSKKYDSLIQTQEVQQKEFIKFLESYLKLFDNMDIYEQGSYDTIEEILQKYKSIIGDDK